MNTNARECELCGEWAGQLIDGVCLPCTRRMVDSEADPVSQEERYTARLATRVRTILSEVYGDVPGVRLVDHIICEALFQAAMDARRGGCVRLEYIGELDVVGAGQGVIYTPSEWVLPRHEVAP